METLEKLGRIMEATRVAMVDVLQILGRALEVKREVESSVSTTSPHEEPPATVQQQQHSDDAGGKAMHTVGVAAAAASTGANEGRREAMSDDVHEEL